MQPLSSLVEYMNGYLGIPGHPDYRNALNGLQVDGSGSVGRVAAAVDASEAVIVDAVAAGADLLIVHHGLFWGGLQPLTGRHYRKYSALVQAGLAVYAAHLPLDGHPEVGNCALLARGLGLKTEGRFGEYDGASLGWWGRPANEEDRGTLARRCEELLGGPVQVVAGGPEAVEKVAVVTGAGGSFLPEAAEKGVDTLITGEGAHHHFTDAHGLGVNLILGGHYRTETFGVKALADHLSERFSLDSLFLDHPSGL